MLKIWGPRRHTDCDGQSRRDFLKVGALGATGLMLPDLLRARAQAAANGGSTRNTSVVWLWLGGGATHVETFDPKMTAPSEFRSVVGAVQTNVPGIELGGLFSQTANVMDKMAVVRSFSHANGGHGGGTHWVMTGYNFPPADNGQRPLKPGMGAILARYRGPNNAQTGLPTYVRMRGILGDGPAWLGAAYAPFDLAGNARNNMNLQISHDQVEERRNLLSTFDDLNREIDHSGLMDGMDGLESQAFGLLLGNAREAFDIGRETQSTRDLYGNNTLGQQMLTARRLCEAGAGFVTINYGGWDMHGNIANSLRNRVPPLDQAIAAFVGDINQRGLQDEVLLVVTGEFGRTPRVNRNAGRDHWAPLSTLALAGGGLNMGQAVGESSDRVERPRTRPISPQDLMATVFHVLGIPQDLHFEDPTGRPMPMVSNGMPIAELI